MPNYCSNCGSSLTHSPKFCGECGSAIETEVITTPRNSLTFPKFADWAELYKVQRGTPHKLLLSDTDRPWFEEADTFAGNYKPSQEFQVYWLADQDEQLDTFDEASKELFNEQATYIANLMSLASDTNFEFNAPFAYFYFETPMGNVGLARISTIEIDGQLVVRLGTPLGYLMNPKDFFQASSTSRSAAGWVALKMQEVVKSTLGISAIEQPLQSKIISQMSGVFVGASDIHSWVAASRSLCGEMGEVYAFVNGDEKVVGSTDQRIVPTLYAGIEIVWKEDNELAQGLFLRQGVLALSVALDSISSYTGLADELSILPMSTP